MKCFFDSKKLFSQCCAKKIKFSIQKYVYLTYFQNGTVKCFQSYSKEESQTLSLFEISRKSLTGAVNQLTKIDVVGMKKENIRDLQNLMQFLPLNAQNWNVYHQETR